MLKMLKSTDKSELLPFKFLLNIFQNKVKKFWTPHIALYLLKLKKNYVRHNNQRINIDAADDNNMMS